MIPAKREGAADELPMSSDGLEPFTLVTLPQQCIEVLGVGFQGFWCWGDRYSLCHLTFLLFHHSITI